MEYRTAVPADEPALQALWAAAFDAPQVPELWGRDAGRHRRTFVAAEDGRVVSVVHYLPRPIRSAAGTVDRVGCVGSVATLPEARGRGHVRHLLAAAVRTMAEDGCGWSLLFTGTPRVYETSGWSVFPLPAWTGPLAVPAQAVPAQAGPTQADSPPAALGVRPARPGDLPALRALRAAYDRDRPLTTVRSEEDWRYRIPAWYAAPAETLVATGPAEEPAGFAVSRPGADAQEVEVVEIALAADAPDRTATLRALLGAVAARSAARGRTRAVARLPHTPEVVAALPALLADPHPLTVRTGMARPIHTTPAALRATLTAPGAAHWYGDSF
ncbi:GNAT family N-acetyltransferase [Streptomyces sp. NPDC092296]|uniref:GNAT family N-acetyltransferase n=1 Tax=Streptomyces sp. NPDC092296 TaxID=3366012 RepID=UPI0038216020